MVIVKPLAKKIDFLKLKKNKKKSIHFVCFFKKKCQDATLSSETFNLTKETKQLGFIIPKKIVKKSSSRNLIKRWTRELIKTNKRLSKAILVVRNLPDLSTKKNKQDIYKELKLLISLVT
jgi:ribonuclease P protein component